MRKNNETTKQIVNTPLELMPFWGCFLLSIPIIPVRETVGRLEFTQINWILIHQRDQKGTLPKHQANVLGRIPIAVREQQHAICILGGLANTLW